MNQVISAEPIPYASRYVLEVKVPASAATHGESDAFNLDITREQAQLLEDHGIRWLHIGAARGHQAGSLIYYPCNQRDLAKG